MYLNNPIVVLARSSVEDMERDVQLSCQVAGGPLAEEVLSHMSWLDVDVRLAAPEEQLEVIKSVGKTGDQEDCVAKPQIGLPDGLDGREECRPIPGVEDSHLVQSLAGSGSRSEPPSQPTESHVTGENNQTGPTSSPALSAAGHSGRSRTSP